jgi:hypothetical protein
MGREDVPSLQYPSPLTGYPVLLPRLLLFPVCHMFLLGWLSIPSTFIQVLGYREDQPGGEYASRNVSYPAHGDAHHTVIQD